MLRLKKKVFGGCKSQIFFIGDQKAGREEARRRSERHGDGFMGPEGHSENLKARMSFLRGSWRLCTASLGGEAGGVTKHEWLAEV